MKLSAMLRWGKQVLEQADVTDAAVDAMELMQYVCGIDRSYYYMHMDEEVSEEKQQRYEVLLQKRASHIPLQQITGKAYFMGLEFYVNEHVLIPRFDTEVLVEETLSCVSKIKKDTENVKVLDMCTGSGCIILSLKDMMPKIEAAGADISDEALKVARKNAQDLKLLVTFLKSDLFAHIHEKYDIIVSNPPYIPTEVIETLDVEVKDHEPRLALDGTKDGLHFYRKISAGALEYLNDGGYLCYEIGHDQGPAVSEILTNLGYINVKVVKDLSGLDRVVLGGKPCLTN